MGKRTSIAVEFRSDTTDIKRGADEVRKETQKLKAHSEAMKVRMVEPPSVSAAQASARAMMAAWGSNVQTVQRDNLAQAVSAQAMFQRQAAQQARTIGGGTVIGQSGHWNFAGAGASGGSGVGGGYGRGATNAGMGMLMLSQGIDDLQYGLRGVINNIAPLVMSLGGGTGLAGALTIAAVGVNVLVTAFDELTTSTEDVIEKNQKNIDTVRQLAALQKERDDKELAKQREQAQAAIEERQRGMSFQERYRQRGYDVQDSEASLRKTQLQGPESKKLSEGARIDAETKARQLVAEFEATRADYLTQFKSAEDARKRIAETEKRLNEIDEKEIELKRKNTMELPVLEAELAKLSGVVGTMSVLNDDLQMMQGNGQNLRGRKNELLQQIEAAKNGTLPIGLQQERAALQSQLSSDKENLKTSTSGWRSKAERMQEIEAESAKNVNKKKEADIAAKRAAASEAFAAMLRDVMVIAQRGRRAFDESSKINEEYAKEQEKAAKRATSRKIRGSFDSIIDAMKTIELVGKAFNEQVKQRADAMKQIASEKEKNEIGKLRQRGKNREADVREDAMSVKEMIDANPGMKPEEAAEIVAGRRRLAQDAQLGPGRRRIRRKPTREEAKDDGIIPWKNRIKEIGGAGGDKLSNAAQGDSEVIKILRQLEQNTKPTPGEKNTPKDQRK